MATVAPLPNEPSQTPLAPQSPSQQKQTSTDLKSVKLPPVEKKKKAAGAQPNTEGTSAVEPAKEKTKDGKDGKKAKDDMTIDDLLLPRTLISRLSRGSLPPNTSLQKDALLALTKSATVFISYLAHTANSLTSRKTIQAEDILKAVSEMELDGVMRDKLEKEIHLFEEGVRGKRKGYRDRVKARESGVSQLDATEIEEHTGEHVHKRVKRSNEDGDIEMEGASDSTGQGENLKEISIPDATHDDEDEDDPSAQLQAEASRAAEHDETESEVDDEDEEDDEGVVENEDDEDEEENEGEDNELGDNGRTRPQYLAPDGRAEVDGSDDDSE